MPKREDRGFERQKEMRFSISLLILLRRYGRVLSAEEYDPPVSL